MNIQSDEEELEFNRASYRTYGSPTSRIGSVNGNLPTFTPEKARIQPYPSNLKKFACFPESKHFEMASPVGSSLNSSLEFPSNPHPTTSRISKESFRTFGPSQLAEWCSSWKNIDGTLHEMIISFFGSEILQLTGFDILNMPDLQSTASIEDVRAFASLAKLNSLANNQKALRFMKLRLKLELIEVKEFIPQLDFCEWDPSKLSHWISTWPGDNSDLSDHVLDSAFQITGTKLLGMTWEDHVRVAAFSGRSFNDKESFLLKNRLEARVKDVKAGYENLGKPFSPGRCQCDTIWTDLIDVQNLKHTFQNWTDQEPDFRHKMLQYYEEVQDVWKPKARMLLWDLAQPEECAFFVNKLRSDVMNLFLHEALSVDNPSQKRHRFREMLIIFSTENSETSSTERLAAFLFREFSDTSDFKRKFCIADLVCWWICTYQEVHWFTDRDREMARDWLRANDFKSIRTKAKKKLALKTLEDLDRKFRFSKASESGKLQEMNVEIEFDSPEEIAKYINRIFALHFANLKMSELHQPKCIYVTGRAFVHNDSIEIEILKGEESSFLEMSNNQDEGEVIGRVVLRAGIHGFGAVCFEVQGRVSKLRVGSMLTTVGGRDCGVHSFAKIKQMVTSSRNNAYTTRNFQFYDHYCPNRLRLANMGVNIQAWVGKELLENVRNPVLQIQVFFHWWKIFEALLFTHHNVSVAIHSVYC